MPARAGLKPWRWLFAACGLCACTAVAAGAMPLMPPDARGERPALAAPAKRIVSLAPHATELLFAAGAGDRLVAAVDFSDHPEAARHLPRIGSSARVDVERLLALAPDLVVGWLSGNDAADIARIERLGVPVYVSEIGGIADIPDEIDALGALAGTTGPAHEASGRLRARIDALGRRYADRAPLRVFYQIWEHPLMTVNGRHFISDSIRLCGGVNVFADIEPIAPTVSVEAVIAADPQVIVVSASAGDNEAGLGAWRRWRSIPAVQTGSLFTIPPDLIARPSPRIIEGVERLCAALESARAASGQRPGSTRGDRQ